MVTSFNWLSRDGKLLLTARATRTFGYGFLSVTLSIYLKLVGYNDLLIGLLLSLTLVNSIIFTLIASFYADRFGRRKMLIVYALLMSMSGVIFFVSNNFFLLIISALVGTINITGSETGAFLSVEQAVLPQTLLKQKDSVKRQNTLFAIYNMVGTFAMSAGILVSGLPGILESQYGLNQIQSIKPLFLLYSLLGIGVTANYFLLSKKIEIDNHGLNNRERKNVTMNSLQVLSPKSRKTVGKLSGLFAVDSFAGGFVIQGIVSLWFFTRFGADLSTISYIFSIAGVLTAFSFLASAKIADRIGLINTMVFTHIPSNILLILVAFAPTLPMAIAFYLARMALSQMDVPTRQSYVVGVVNEDERTAAVGISNISRNVAQSISPSIAGSILQSLSFLSAPFIIGGVLKIVYDVALYLNFKRTKSSYEE